MLSQLKMFSKEVRKRLAETHYNRMVAEYDEAIRNSIEKSFVHSVGPEDAEPRGTGNNVSSCSMGIYANIQRLIYYRRRIVEEHNIL